MLESNIELEKCLSGSAGWRVTGSQRPVQEEE
jgi:hypothetical protein